MSGALLTVDRLTAGYGDATILEDVSLQLAPHGSLALLGRNGAGKSTLVATLMGLTRVQSGTVAFGAHEITHWRPHRRAHAGMGWVPQEREVFRSLSVTENLTVIARSGGWTLARVHELFPRLAERGSNLAHQLSGGEQQMLACGRALVGNPDILLMDEPSEGLAPLLVRELGRMLAGLKAGGASILIVEQNLAFALRIADHVYLMSKGKIVHESRPDELLRNQEVKARYLGV